MKKRKRRTTPLDTSSWYRPETQARYWASKIGRIVSVSGKGAQTRCLLRFFYHHDGKALEQVEEFSFARSSLREVRDFAARVRRHVAPAAAFVDDPDTPEVEDTTAPDLTVNP